MPQAVAAVSSWLVSAGFSAATSAWLATAAVNLAGSTLLQMAASKLARRPGSPESVRDLSLPTSWPAYRFVYGDTIAVGTPAPLRPKGQYIYGALILNSRPSHAIDKVFLDKRPVDLAGDALDFNGPGAQATNDPFDGHFTCWIGLGDQVAPPARILAEAGDIFTSSDGWRGLTVMWVRIKAGKSSKRADRWPSSPPRIECRGRFSRLWDPRDPAQSSDDPATWGFSDNQGLAVLDALMNNPIRRYPLENLEISQFIAAANIAYELVRKKDRSTERRYCVSGTLEWQGDELMTQLAPLFEAGASDAVRQGGRLGIVPGAMPVRAAVIDDVLDEAGMEFTAWRSGRDMSNAIQTRYVSLDRGGELAALKIYAIPGAQAADGGLEKIIDQTLTLVSSPTQAMRLRKIRAGVERLQRAWSGVVPPQAIAAVAGSVVDLSLPPPYGAMNGPYRVQSIKPRAEIASESGVFLRCGVELREVSASIYSYDPATDEEAVEKIPFDPFRKGVQPPASIAIETGAAGSFNTGDGIIAGLWATWGASPSPGITAYRWLARKSGQAVWTMGGVIDVSDGDADTDRVAMIYPVTVDGSTRYEVSVTALIGAAESVPVVAADILPLPPDVHLLPPLAGSAQSNAPGQITISFRAPNVAGFRGMFLVASNTDDHATASPVGGVVAGAANAMFSWSETDILPGSTRYYWAHVVGPYGVLSPPSPRLTATAS